MNFEVLLSDYDPVVPVRVGNVYPVKGGRGLRDKHMQILLAITEGNTIQGPMCLFLVVSKEGKPVGVNSYGQHYVQDLMPIGFVADLDQINMEIRSL